MEDSENKKNAEYQISKFNFTILCIPSALNFNLA